MARGRATRSAGPGRVGGTPVGANLGPLPGLGASYPGRQSEINNVRSYSSRGLSSPGTLGSFPVPQIGFLIPGTGKVYVRPRLTNSLGLGPDASAAGGSQGPIRSGSVTITNTAYASGVDRRRTRSIGMGGAGQVGLGMDVGARGER